MCLVPGVIAKLHCAVKILVGHKSYSTLGAVGRHQKREAACPRKSERSEREPIAAAVGRSLPFARLHVTGKVDRNAFQRTGIDIAGGSGKEGNGRPICQTIVLSLRSQRWRLTADRPCWRIVYCHNVDRGAGDDLQRRIIRHPAVLHNIAHSSSIGIPVVIPLRVSSKMGIVFVNLTIEEVVRFPLFPVVVPAAHCRPAFVAIPELLTGLWSGHPFPGSFDLRVAGTHPALTV